MFRNRNKSYKDKTKFVVAIDIGSSFSSFAYAKKDEKRLSIAGEGIEVKKWSQGTLAGLSKKAPTSILLTERGELTEFGYEAEDFYKRLSSTERIHYRLFRRIKHTLITNKPQFAKPDWLIEDVDGNGFSAMTLVEYTLQSLMNNALMDIQSKISFGIQKEDISWMITIPAIWDDFMKFFMRKAAENVKIPYENITMILESEAAAIWCANVRDFYIKNDETSEIRSLTEGTKFVLLDLGGCTIDISAQEVSKSGHMKLILPPKGCQHGGIDVDKKFEKLLEKAFGEDVIKDFKGKHQFLYMKLLSEFEFQKRQKSGELRLTLPNKLLEIYKQRGNDNVKDTPTIYRKAYTSNNVAEGESNYLHRDFRYLAGGSSDLEISTKENHAKYTPNEIHKKEDMLDQNIVHQVVKNEKHSSMAQVESTIKIDEEKEEIVCSSGIIMELYRNTTDIVIQELGAVLQEKACKEVKVIILVGGLSDSDAVHRAVCEKYSNDYAIYRPQEAELAVLKGAVMFGLDPAIVLSRVCRFTYGIAVFEEFKPGFHDENKKMLRNNKFVCKDCFSKKYTIGEHVDVGSITEFKVFDTFSPLREEKRYQPIKVDIFTSKDENPKYTTDENCNKLCSIIITPNENEEGGKWPTTVKGIVNFKVAKTELLATFRNENRKQEGRCKFDFV